MSLIGSFFSGIGKTIQSAFISISNKKDNKKTDLPPEVDDIDITIAKLKSEKRKINEKIRKVMHGNLI